MADKVEQLEFSNENQTAQTGPVTCLGMTFENDEDRRAYFTEELRKKLPELRKIEGFPIGEDEDILALSDPPYYTACPNPWTKEILNEWKKSSEGHKQKVCPPFVSDVSEGKYDPLYKLHPYPTKVPHKAIMRYILHYTNPGDVVYDGFSGTGMTGVAAQLCGDKSEVETLGYDVSQNGEIIEKNSRNKISDLGQRRVIVNDLSTIASYLTYQHNKNVNPRLCKEMLNRLDDVIDENIWMFSTFHSSGKDANNGTFNMEEMLNISDEKHLNYVIKRSKLFGNINYVVWSEVFICSQCSNELIFWDVAVDKENGKVNEKFACCYCGTINTKRTLDRAKVTFFDDLLGEVVTQTKYMPVLINYTFGSKRFEKKPDQLDLHIIEMSKKCKLNNWVPIAELPLGDKTEEPKRMGITHVHHFYTRRNLKILSDFFRKEDRRDFSFPLTRVASQITNMYRFTYQSGVWGAGGGPLSGTLYIPSLIKELSIHNQLKLAIIQQSDKKGLFDLSNIICSTGSSTQATFIEDNSIDYIFIDPPFGANLMYSELNFIWEAWLNLYTNNRTEAIINNTQKKDIDDYRTLMSMCLKEAYRILKPGKWITVEFSNTKSSVWNSIQIALQEAGFIVANVSVLDKQKTSFKAVTTTTAVKQDLVISAYKPNIDLINKVKGLQNFEDSVWNFVEYHLAQLPVFIGDKGSTQLIIERTPRILFDRMIAYHVQNGLTVPLSSAEFQAGVEQRFPMRDGMAFLETQVAEYDKKRIQAKDFVQLSLFVSDENSAIEWLRQQLLKKPQTRQDLHPNFMKEIQHIAKHEKLPELDVLLEQNFLMYDGEGEVPSQIHSYLSSDYKDLRGLDKNDPKLKEKAKNRWYVPDPNKQADLEKLREKSLLREFNQYVEELSNNKKKLKQFRTEAIRVGFYKAWTEKNYQIIVDIGNRLPESILQEDEKLLRYYDNAQTKLGL